MSESWNESTDRAHRLLDSEQVPRQGTYGDLNLADRILMLLTMYRTSKSAVEVLRREASDLQKSCEQHVDARNNYGDKIERLYVVLRDVERWMEDCPFFDVKDALSEPVEHLGPLRTTGETGNGCT